MVTPAAGSSFLSFFLLGASGDLATSIPVAGGVAGCVYAVTAVITSWFIPRAEIKETYLGDVREGAWFVERRGAIAVVAQVSVVSRDDWYIKYALLDGKGRFGEPTDKVWIAELRDPYQRWRHQPLPAAGFDRLDRDAVKKFVTDVYNFRPHSYGCDHDADRKKIEEWTKREKLEARLDAAFRWGFFEEQDGEIRLTDAGRILLEVPATRKRVPEPPVEPPRNIWIMHPVGSIITLGPSTQSQLATGSNSTQDLNARSNDEKKVLDLLGVIADNQDLLTRLLPMYEIDRMRESTAVLADEVDGGDLRAPKVKRALHTLWVICQSIVLDVAGSAVWDELQPLFEALRHLF